MATHRSSLASLRRLSQPVIFFIMLGIMPVLRIYLQDQDAFEEWRPTEKRQTIAERPTGIQRLLSTLGKSEELGKANLDAVGEVKSNVYNRTSWIEWCCCVSARLSLFGCSLRPEGHNKLALDHAAYASEPRAPRAECVRTAKESLRADAQSHIDFLQATFFPPQMKRDSVSRLGSTCCVETWNWS